MTEQWQNLKETIIEMRDNDGTGTQQEVCKFLINYMGILEKQMQESCEDVINREDAQTEIMMSKSITAFDRDLWIRTKDAVHILRELPSVTQKSDNKYRKEAKRWKNKWLKSQKSGHWIEHKNNGMSYIECSKCSSWFLRMYLTRNSYCPNCGCCIIKPQESEKNKQC